MKLSIACLLVAFACVMAIPMPQEEGKREGTMERMYDMFTGFPKAMLNMGEGLMGGNPFVKMMTQGMKNMMDMGKNIAKNMDGN